MINDVSNDSHQREFLRMVVSLMKILIEDAVKSAERVARLENRRVVLGGDMVRALKYESHAFWERDIDDRFVENLQEEREHTYTTDSEDDEDDESDESEDQGESDAADDDIGTELVPVVLTPEDVAFRESVDRIEREWSDWAPEDPVKMLLKRSIDSTCNNLMVSS